MGFVPNFLVFILHAMILSKNLEVFVELRSLECHLELQ